MIATSSYGMMKLLETVQRSMSIFSWGSRVGLKVGKFAEMDLVVGYSSEEEIERRVDQPFAQAAPSALSLLARMTTQAKAAASPRNAPKLKRARRLGGGETASSPRGERCILSAIEVVSASRSMACITGRSRVFIHFMCRVTMRVAKIVVETEAFFGRRCSKSILRRCTA